MSCCSLLLRELATAICATWPLTAPALTPRGGERGEAVDVGGEEDTEGEGGGEEERNADCMRTAREGDIASPPLYARYVSCMMLADVAVSSAEEVM